VARANKWGVVVSQIGVLRPQYGSSNLLVGFAPAGQQYPPWTVQLTTQSATYANSQWDTNSALGSPNDTIVSRYTQYGQVILTANADAPGESVFVQLAGSGMQTWRVIQLTQIGPRACMLITLGGNALQATNLNGVSSMILGTAGAGTTPIREQVFVSTL
jgi:hypothetical protein